jgi:hypothetical protein
MNTEAEHGIHEIVFRRHPVEVGPHSIDFVRRLKLLETEIGGAGPVNIRIEHLPAFIAVKPFGAFPSLHRLLSQLVWFF